MTRRWIGPITVLIVLALGAAGCGGGGDRPGGEPSRTTATASPSSTDSNGKPSPSTSASPALEVWREKFSSEQLIAYDQALATWKQYSAIMERYRREPVGRATVQKVFEQYTYNVTALTDSYVANYVKGGVRQLSPPTPRSWTGRKIKLNPKGSLVEFDQCTDYTTVDIRRNGRPIEGAAPTENDTAILRVQMSSDKGGSWRSLSTKVVDKACS